MSCYAMQRHMMIQFWRVCVFKWGRESLVLKGKKSMERETELSSRAVFPNQAYGNMDSIQIKTKGETEYSPLIYYIITITPLQFFH